MRLYVMKCPQFEWRPSLICQIKRPRRVFSLAPAIKQIIMALAIRGSNLVLLGRFEQFGW